MKKIFSRRKPILINVYFSLQILNLETSFSSSAKTNELEEKKQNPLWTHLSRTRSLATFSLLCVEKSTWLLFLYRFLIIAFTPQLTLLR